MRSMDFNRIYGEFINYYKDTQLGESEYYSWLRDMRLDESQFYGQARESFKWARSEEHTSELQSLS